MIQSWKHAINGGLMLAYRLSGSLAGIFIYGVSMRRYGPRELGKYAYAIAVIQIVAPLLIGGIEPMLIREIVRRPSDRLELLGSSFSLVLWATIVAVLVPFLYVLATNYRDTELIAMVLGLSLSLLPNCLLVVMAFFRAESRITLATICGFAGVAVSAGSRIALVLLGKPLYYVTAAAILEPLITGAALLFFYRKTYGSVLKWRTSKHSMIQLLSLSWSAILASFVVMLFFRLSHLMLKSLSSFDQLGYYAVAFQMFTVLNLLPNSVLSVVYPRLVQLHNTNVNRYNELTQLLYVLVTVSGVAICVGVWFFVLPIVTLAFGAKSAPVAPIAFVMSIANLFTFSGAVRSQVIYIEHKPIYHVYNTVLGLAVLIPLNFFLIPKYGAVGAAMSVATACFASGVASSWMIPALRSTGLDQVLAFAGLRRHLLRIS
jgi:polysaccharide transporter, PST family